MTRPLHPREYNTLEKLLQIPPHLLLAHITDMQLEHGPNWYLDLTLFLHVKWHASILIYLLDLNRHPPEWIQYHFDPTGYFLSSTWHLHPAELTFQFELVANSLLIPQLDNWCLGNPPPPHFSHATRS